MQICNNCCVSARKCVLGAFDNLTDGREFRIKVTPKASRNKVVADSDGPDDLRVYVTVVPEDGKANAAVMKLLSKTLGVAKTRIKIVRGQTGRNKVLKVE